MIINREKQAKEFFEKNNIAYSDEQLKALVKLFKQVASGGDIPFKTLNKALAA